MAKERSITLFGVKVVPLRYGRTILTKKIYKEQFGATAVLLENGTVAYAGNGPFKYPHHTDIFPYSNRFKNLVNALWELRAIKQADYDTWHQKYDALKQKETAARYAVEILRAEKQLGAQFKLDRKQKAKLKRLTKPEY